MTITQFSIFFCVRNEFLYHKILFVLHVDEHFLCIHKTSNSKLTQNTFLPQIEELCIEQSLRLSMQKKYQQKHKLLQEG